jgi:hypothetical protein
MKVEALFDKMGPYLKEKGGDIVKKVGFVYHI